MDIVLYDWAPSPFCIKVRSVLEYKSLPYRRVNALDHVRELKQRGASGKAPAIDIGGTLISDSTDIVHELERRKPGPLVLPIDPRDRALCHVIEDWADESLYFIGLYYHWYQASGREQVRTYFGRSLIRRVAFYRYLKRILAQLEGQGTSRKSPDGVARDLARHLDAVDAMIAGGDFLTGPAPYLCDFALAAQLIYLQRAPLGAAALQARPTITAYVERVRAAHRANAARPA